MIFRVLGEAGWTVRVDESCAVHIDVSFGRRGSIDVTLGKHLAKAVVSTELIELRLLVTQHFLEYTLCSPASWADDIEDKYAATIDGCETPAELKEIIYRYKSENVNKWFVSFYRFREDVSVLCRTIEFRAHEAARGAQLNGRFMERVMSWLTRHDATLPLADQI